MEVLVILVPLALVLGFVGLAGFLWSLKNGQYDDLEGAGWRAIADDDVSRESRGSPAADAGLSAASDRIVQLRSRMRASASVSDGSSPKTAR
jgi:cbb3-type cytochrome oxidase maturation protein